MPNVHRVELIGQEVIADRLGVTTQAISNWYKRDLPGLPVPTLVEYKAGKPPMKVWRRGQLGTWDTWHARHTAKRGKHTPLRNRKDAA